MTVPLRCACGGSVFWNRQLERKDDKRLVCASCQELFYVLSGNLIKHQADGTNRQAIISYLLGGHTNSFLVGVSVSNSILDMMLG